MRPSLDLRADEAVATRPAAIDLDDLDVGELLVIWALRMRLSRGPDGPVAGFRLAFGLSGIESALARFEAVFDLLQRHCRCNIGMHAPGCRRVSRDELTVVTAIAALQADAALHAHAMAARLVGAGVVKRFIERAGDLAVTLGDHGLLLPLRAAACSITAGPTWCTDPSLVGYRMANLDLPRVLDVALDLSKAAAPP